ncbi:MAG: 2-oxo acid dehydrogenase subunit E2, partial [Spirochaetia bacterium]|nr:2-oxo acid dehydrogenase subunit E2 [Spirochaetia bacterium]
KFQLRYPELGRILAKDLAPSTASSQKEISLEDTYTEKPVKGIRKVTATRMAESLHSTAQFTMTSYAKATALQQLRKRLKESDASLGLNNITINDLVMFAVTKTLLSFPYMNAHFLTDTIREYASIHVGCAVDTPKGLLVPVIKHAQSLSLKELSDTAKQLALAAIDGKAQMDDLSGSTFTVTNLGALGIDSFTPVINIPEVAILGVGGISLRPVGKGDSDVSFVPHISLSLTINHMAVDGAPGAKFLLSLVKNIESIDLLLAL